MATLAERLLSVQTAIAAIESGAQSTATLGDTLTRPDLQTLYNQEAKLLNQIDRESRGRVTVYET